jgi:hypothetical protein
VQVGAALGILAILVVLVIFRNHDLASQLGA